MRTPLFRFLVLLCVLLVGLEIFVRINGRYLYALSDKLLLKAEILNREPNTKILFLGTSRFLDSINHHTFTEELEKKTGVQYLSLNGATTGLQSERLAFFAKIAEENNGLTHVILEASPPTMTKGRLSLPKLPGEASKNEPDTDLADLSFPDRIENQLQSFLVDHVATVQYRKALRPKSLIKLFVLYSAKTMDPNIWSRKGPLQAMLFPKDEETTPALIESLAPTQVLSSEFNGTIPETEEFQNLHRVAKIFENSGKEIIWIAPPVSKQAVPGNHKPIYTQYYAALAQEFDQDFYNYAGIGFDEELLRDATHLNATGRSLFSKVIAHHLAHHFEKD